MRPVIILAACLGMSIADAALANGLRLVPAAGVGVSARAGGPVRLARAHYRGCRHHRFEIFSYPPTYMADGRFHYYYPRPFTWRRWR